MIAASQAVVIDYLDKVGVPATVASNVLGGIALLAFLGQKLVGN